jgi:hypothetical protein
MPRRKDTTTRTRQPARDVNATERQLRAIQLRKEGHEWQEIANLCGIRGGKGAAYQMVNRALKAALRESAEEYRELLGARLDALWRIQFAKATEERSDWAVDRCLQIIDRQERLYNLAIKPDVSQQQAQMVLIGVSQDVLEAV